MYTCIYASEILVWGLLTALDSGEVTLVTGTTHLLLMYILPIDRSVLLLA